MSKPLSEMSLKELWELFPIVLTKHQNSWKKQYKEENEKIKKIVNSCDFVRISHIGSTAIKGIWAKPIIDILLEVSKECDFQMLKMKITKAGWICMAESKTRIDFNKGYTQNGFANKVFHLHLRREGDADEIYFCNYLNTHPTTAKEYEALKLSLWKSFEHDRDGYTNAKTKFVKQITSKAKINSL